MNCFIDVNVGLIIEWLIQAQLYHKKMLKVKIFLIDFDFKYQVIYLLTILRHLFHLTIDSTRHIGPNNHILYDLLYFILINEHITIQTLYFSIKICYR